MSTQTALTLDPATEFLTVADLAHLLHIREQTVHRWRKAGKLPPPLRLGHRWLWRRDAIEALLQDDQPKAG